MGRAWPCTHTLCLAVCNHRFACSMYRETTLALYFVRPREDTHLQLSHSLTLVTDALSAACHQDRHMVPLIIFLYPSPHFISLYSLISVHRHPFNPSLTVCSDIQLLCISFGCQRWVTGCQSGFICPVPLRDPVFLLRPRASCFPELVDL